MTKTPLEIELVPSTCWWSNVRSQVTKAQWETCKTLVRRRSGNRCEICGGAGTGWAIECHEIWRYDDDKQIQTLVGLIALCPNCHRAKHLGRSQVKLSPGALDALYGHICKVNGWGWSHLMNTVLPTVFAIWSIRSEWDWGLDVSYLAEIGVQLPKYVWAPHERVVV